MLCAITSALGPWLSIFVSHSFLLHFHERLTMRPAMCCLLITDSDGIDFLITRGKLEIAEVFVLAF
jgi:hypothetical protein